MVTGERRGGREALRSTCQPRWHPVGTAGSPPQDGEKIMARRDNASAPGVTNASPVPCLVMEKEYSTQRPVFSLLSLILSRSPPLSSLPSLPLYLPLSLFLPLSRSLPLPSLFLLLSLPFLSATYLPF